MARLWDERTEKDPADFVDSKKTNEWFPNKAGVKRELLDTVKARNLAYYGYTMRKQWSCQEKEIVQETMSGARRRGRPHTAWMDNIKTWTGLSMEESIRMTEDRDKWRKYVHGVANPRIEDSWRTNRSCHLDTTRQMSAVSVDSRDKRANISGRYFVGSCTRVGSCRPISPNIVGRHGNWTAAMVSQSLRRQNTYSLLFAYFCRCEIICRLSLSARVSRPASSSAVASKTAYVRQVAHLITRGALRRLWCVVPCLIIIHYSTIDSLHNADGVTDMLTKRLAPCVLWR